MSWREFRFNLRPIALRAIGCFVFTTIAIAGANHWLLGFSWPAGFLVRCYCFATGLGRTAFHCSTDEKLPMRILVILEGEGRANDATALVAYWQSQQLGVGPSVAE